MGKLKKSQRVMLHKYSKSLVVGRVVAAGKKVLLSKNVGGNTKTAYKVEMAVTGEAEVRVGANPLLAEALAAAMLKKKLVPELALPEQRVSRQIKIEGSLIDFELFNEANDTWALVEVKNVPLATDDGVAIFPYGSINAKTKVVSSRAIKHVDELRRKVVEGTKCAVLFVVSRDDCHSFRPGEECDVLFARVLRRAFEAGVQIIAVDWDWREDVQEIWIGKTLPIIWGPESLKEVDEDWLARVLEHEATGEKRSNWKANKKREEKKAAAAPAKKKKAAPKKRAKEEEVVYEDEDDDDDDDVVFDDEDDDDDDEEMILLSEESYEPP